MGIGSKIKEYRTKAGLTQKELADELHVTYQAVSRWENDDAEPSFDTLRDMCRIFNCSTDDLFGIEKKPVEEKVEEKPQEPQVIERIIVQEQKPVLGVCEQCNKPIYEATNLNRVADTYQVRVGRGTRTETRQRILCNECNEIKLLEQERLIDQRKKQTEEEFRKRRIHSIVWPAVISIVCLVIAISFFANGNTSSGIAGIVISILGYTFVATLILDNTFINDLWEGIASLGFVKLPGIIFEFSIDGFVFLIAMKILFFIIGVLFSILAFTFATALSLVLSIFVYPFALRKNLKCEE